MLNLPLNITKIIGKVKSDNWGGKEYIAKLISIEDKTKRYSEYWLGVHQLHPSTLATDANIHLIEYISLKLNLPFNTLSANFPFLLKVLDVEKMLSIQLHPNKINAQKGFEGERAKKIEINSENRIYKDPNAKYEALFAITNFYLLQGFLEREQLILNLEKYFPAKLKDDFINDGYQKLSKSILDLSNDQTSAITNNIFKKLKAKDNSTDKQNICYWVSKYLDENTNTNTSIDKGILFMYLLNLIKLNKGEVIYTKPCVLHSYLYGKCAEIMTNSDNVIRLGLTKKTIDHKEIYNNLNTAPSKPAIVRPSLKNNSYKKYVFKEANFSFTIIDAKKALKADLEAFNIEIILTLKGFVNIKYKDKKINIKQGESAVILPKINYIIEASEPTLAIIASSISSFK